MASLQKSDTRYPRRSLRSLSRALWLAGPLAAVLTALIWRASFPTPFQDELLFESLYSALAQGRMPPLDALLAAHNGHPYLLVKSLLSATLLLGLPWTWLMYAQVAVLIGCLIVITAARSGGAVPLAVLPIALLLLSPRQWENLYWAMQFAFPASLFFSLFAFLATDRFGDTGQRRWALLAVGAALLASVSNGAGIFALALVCGTLLVVRSDMRVRVIAIVSLTVGVAAFAIAQSIAPRSGIGGARVDVLEAAEHAVRMVGHQFIDGSARSPWLLVLGLASSIAVVFVLAKALRTWRENVFELLCICLSIVLIAGVTYSRVSAGIFQPDAPRYLPLIAPLAVGTAFLLARSNYRLPLAVFTVFIATGYLTSVWSEWKIAPYRRGNLSEAHRVLCQYGGVHAAHNMAGYVLRGSALSDVRSIFCKDAIGTVKQVDAGNIATTSAVGFYSEDRQSWIGPRLSLVVPSGLAEGRVTISGWLPDLQAYPAASFQLEVLADGIALHAERPKSAGHFSVEVQLPPGASLLEVRAPARKAVQGDERLLSWLLVSVAFR